MTPSLRRVDRRIKRTRQLLRQASIEILEEKGFQATTIQDITERANVHRGTFYAHFADKYALIDVICRENFQQLLASTLPSRSCWDRDTLYMLIQAVLEYAMRIDRHRSTSKDVGLLMERAVQEELNGLLERWLTQRKSGAIPGHVPIEAMARIASAAIFGAALQWSQEPATISLEQMANAILLVVLEGLNGAAHVIPGTSPMQ